MRDQGNGTGRRRIGPAALCAGALAAAALLAATPRSEGESEGPLAGTRTALEQWVETRRLISQEERDWAIGRELLQERISLVRDEIESNRAATEVARESITRADVDRDELLAQRAEHAATADFLLQRVVELEARTRALLKRLPEPLVDQVKPVTQRIPAAGEEVRLSVGERYLNVVGVLNAVNKFNRDVTATSEVRALADGTTAEVTAIYLGLGQAFYASGDGKAAGVGIPGDGAWAWTAHDDAAAEIARAIGIYKSEVQPADFTLLPASIEVAQ